MKRSQFSKPVYSEWLAKQKNKKPSKPALKRGSMTKPIPTEMKERFAEDDFMNYCCLAGNNCCGRVQFHHNLIYAGKRINEYGAILPVCEYHHEKESKFKKELNAIMYSRMTNADRAKYPRKKWL